VFSTSQTAVAFGINGASLINGAPNDRLRVLAGFALQTQSQRIKLERKSVV
jgi:hypothetical protein